MFVDLFFMKPIFFITFLFFSLFGHTQQHWDEMSGKQKAFFYNISRSIITIKPELFHLFEFTDSIPYINDTLPDYGYIEKQIIADSSKLVLHTSEFSRKNNGLIADLATYYALWELDLLLQFRNSEKEKFNYLKPKLKVFETYVLEKAPQAAIKSLSNGDYQLANSIRRYYAPNLNINEKIAAIKNSGFSENDQLLIIRAIYHAQEKYVAVRSLEIFKLLGGNVDDYINYLIAAGDGDNYSDLEMIYISNYMRALPDPKALFKFDTKLIKNEKTNAIELKALPNPIKRLVTHPIYPTQIHIDVWGYHPERQTTIVIQKGGNSYILYGNNSNRFVSPDSTFDGGSTYWRLIYELEHIHIADLKEKIYGKRGYDYWIKTYEERIQKTMLNIKKTEIELNKIRMIPTGQPKMKKKKIKKKDLGKSDQDNQGHPTGKPTGVAKKRQVLQNKLVAFNSQLENEKRTLKELVIEKEEAYDLLVKYETQLDIMKKNVGHTFVAFKSDKKGNYTFDDGSTFNYLTQDFMFKPNGTTTNFDIITIAFGEKVFSKTIEEVFVHLNVTYPNPKTKYTLYKEVTSKDQIFKLTTSDSIQIAELFTAIGTSKKKLTLNVIGGGILGGTSPDYYRDSTQMTVPFDKTSQKGETIYVYKANIDEMINVSLTTFRHAMIPENFNEKFGSYYAKAKTKVPQLNEIDFYTIYLSKQRMDQWLKQVIHLAETWLEKSSYQSKVIKTLKTAKNKNYYSILDLNQKIKLPKK
jgi:hypothetical protein